MAARLTPTRAYLMCLVLLWPAVSCASAASEGGHLQPYQATYRTKAMGLNVTVERQLAVDGSGYRLSSEGSSFLASIKEVAHFDLVDGRVQGKDYVYELKSLVKRRREVQFLPQQGLIKSLRKDQWTEHAWAPEVLDRFSQQEQLRLDLIAAAATSESGEAPSELSFTVVDGDRIKIRTLDLVAKETLTTPLGDLDSLHYRQRRDSGSNRSSDIWVAPSLDFMMVLTQHVEDDSVIEIALQSLSVAPAAAD